ncbi:hypothetical protein CHITON_1415 [Thermococcus chitonophagus]|nr:hypothetical protein CHITON_1415 [Thermococcus chitonophagus]
MAKGYYYNIKTPYEVFQTRRGTYADMALFAAYALARDGFETYLFYIRTEKGFGVLPGFKIIVDHPWVPREPLVIFWPFRIPMRLSAALKLLEIVGDPPKNITVWDVKYEDGRYEVEKLGTIPASEFQFQATEWMLFGTPEVEVMNELLERDFPGCKFTLNLGALTENAKAIKVEVPYGLLLFSYPFRERYTEILYTVMLSNKTLVKELTECKVLLLAQDASIDLNNPPANYTAIYSGWVGK